MSEERRPSSTDYMAAAVLAYGIVYFWIELKTVAGAPDLLGYPIYYLSGLIPSYLVCKRTGSAHLAVGVKTAALSWGVTFMTLLAFTRGTNLTFFAVLLVLMLLGGASAAYIILRRRLAAPAVEEGPDSVTS